SARARPRARRHSLRDGFPDAAKPPRRRRARCRRGHSRHRQACAGDRRGDTGSDCIGTSNRQGAKSVTQIEILPVPPEHEDKLLTWPDWPMKLRTSSSQEEGIRRDWRTSNEGRPVMEEVPDSHFEIRADLVLLAMGFLHPQRNGAVAALKLA